MTATKRVRCKGHVGTGGGTNGYLMINDAPMRACCEINDTYRRRFLSGKARDPRRLVDMDCVMMEVCGRADMFSVFSTEARGKSGEGTEMR